MTTLFRVIQESDYIDETVADSAFYSMDKNEALEFAKKLYIKVNSEDDVNVRPNLMRHHQLFTYHKENKRPLGYMTENVFLESIPMATDITRVKPEVLWTPSFEDAEKVFQTELAHLFFIDLNLKLSDEEIQELQSLFIKNPELFREGKAYGVVKHSGELLKLLKAEKLEESFSDIEQSI